MTGLQAAGRIAPFLEATVYLNDQPWPKPDGTPYVTPCTIEDLPAEVHRVTFKREGLPDRDAGYIDFAEVRQIVAPWNPDEQPDKQEAE